MLEKEASSMKDVNALLQTIYLDKFKFINNKFIKRKQRICTKFMYKEMKQSQFKAETSKANYIQKLILYNNKSDTSKNKRVAPLICNTDWPICIYDHSYKNRYTTYFAFRSANNIHIIEDYFDVASFSFTKERRLSEDSYNSFTKKKHHTNHKKPYNSLLIERNTHYCGNKEYVRKINNLLNQEESEWAFNDSYIGTNINDEISLLNSMENYMDFIMDIDENEDKQDTQPPPVERVKSSMGNYGGSRAKEKKKVFRLGAYLSRISPKKEHKKIQTIY